MSTQVKEQLSGDCPEGATTGRHYWISPTQLHREGRGVPVKEDRINGSGVSTHFPIPVRRPFAHNVAPPTISPPTPLRA